MKKTVLAMACILLLSIFAGCSGSLDENQLFTVRNRNNGKTISLGDTRDYVNSVNGEEGNIIDYTELGIEQVFYWDMPGISVDFRDGIVVGLLLVEENRWETSEKLRVGMSYQDAREAVSDHKFIEDGLQGGILLGYDENWEPAPFENGEAPYYRVITFEDGKISSITLQEKY